MIEDSLDSPYIHSAGADNFTALVLENSHAGPVLVNFWSEKAGPCLRQYPILDKLVYHYGGRLLLVNINADTEVNITREYGIASVPTLKLFRHGEIVETRHGFQSEADLQKMLDQYVAQESDKALAQAIEQYARGQHTRAYEMITEAIIADPVNPRLPLALCKLLKHEGRHQEALALIDKLPVDIAANRDIVFLQNQLEFSAITTGIDNTETLQQQVENNPTDPELKKQLSAYYVEQQNYEQALSTLVDIMEQDQNFDEEYARKAMLRIFILLGDEHPLINEYRPQLRRYHY